MDKQEQKKILIDMMKEDEELGLYDEPKQEDEFCHYSGLPSPAAYSKEEPNMISDWLEQNRNPEIDKQVERELEYLSRQEIKLEEVFNDEKKENIKKFIDKYKQKQHLIDMMQDDEESGLYDYGWCKGNVILPKEYPGEYDDTQAKQVSQLANNLKQETLEEAIVDYSNDATQQLAFLNGVKWQAERMYSEEDMAESFMACWKANVPEGFECKLSFKEWFNEFKKK